ATLFTLLSGHFVHEARTVQEQLITTATERARSIGALVPGLSPPVVELIDRALAFDKESRWPNARAMQEALRAGLRPSEAEGGLALPVPSIVSNENVPATLVAPQTPGAMSASQTQTYTTARPVTQGVPSAWASKRRGNRALVVLGVASLVGSAALLVVR